MKLPLTILLYLLALVCLPAKNSPRIEERTFETGLNSPKKITFFIRWPWNKEENKSLSSTEVQGLLAYCTPRDGEDDVVRFTGKHYDPYLSGGTVVFPYRNLDPEVARWTSADPAGFPDGTNQHYYAPVPTHQIDPLGLAITLTSCGPQIQGSAFFVGAAATAGENIENITVNVQGGNTSGLISDEAPVYEGPASGSGLSQNGMDGHQARGNFTPGSTGMEIGIEYTDQNGEFQIIIFNIDIPGMCYSGNVNVSKTLHNIPTPDPRGVLKREPQE